MGGQFQRFGLALAVALWTAVVGACGGGDLPPNTSTSIDISAIDGAVSRQTDASADLSADSPSADALDAANSCPGGPGCPCHTDQDCGTGNPCIYGVACEAQACTAGFLDPCEDDDPCTTDSCGLPAGCSHTWNEHWCSDGDPCTTGDTCSQGACVSGPPKACDDANPCTNDSCVVSQGCQFAFNTMQCAEANDCVEASFCTMGGCQQGKAKPCDDGQACTYDGCDPSLGCEYIALPGSASCTDGLAEAGRCWKAVKAPDPLTWGKGRAFCQQWGGELASVRHMYDNQRARKLADAACGAGPAWIGLSDRAQEGKFVWADGESSMFRQWNAAEPNDYGGEDVTELTPSGGWNDLPESAVLGCLVCARPLAAPSCDDGEPCTAPSLCQGATCLPSAASSDCDDGNPCTADGCAVGLGCGHTAVEDGSECGGGLCQGGGCVMAKPLSLPSSCKWVPPESPSGIYWLDADGDGPQAPFQAWCDLKGDGGGWTLVIEVDGGSEGAGWAAPLWTEATASSAANLWASKENARHPGYASLPVQQLRVGMAVAGVTRTLVIDAAGPNLWSMLNGKPIDTKADLLQWEALLPKGSLQAHCHAQGLAVTSANGAKVRIGILGNNEQDCGSVDSWLGLGATAVVCGQKSVPTAGNVACWSPDHGYANTAAVGWVMVR